MQTYSALVLPDIALHVRKAACFDRNQVRCSTGAQLLNLFQAALGGRSENRSWRKSARPAPNGSREVRRNVLCCGPANPNSHQPAHCAEHQNQNWRGQEQGQCRLTQNRSSGTMCKKQEPANHVEDGACTEAAELHSRM